MLAMPASLMKPHFSSCCVGMTMRSLLSCTQASEAAEAPAAEKRKKQSKRKQRDEPEIVRPAAAIRHRALS